jgi:hypothetical protein
MLDFYQHQPTITPNIRVQERLSLSLEQLQAKIDYHIVNYMLVVNRRVGDGMDLVTDERMTIAKTLAHSLQQLIETLPQYDTRLLDNIQKLDQMALDDCHVQFALSFREIQLIYQYLFAVIMNNMLQFPDFNSGDFQAEQAAITLLNLQAYDKWYYYYHQNIFLAGLVLKRSGYSHERNSWDLRLADPRKRACKKTSPKTHGPHSQQIPWPFEAVDRYSRRIPGQCTPLLFMGRDMDAEIAIWEFVAVFYIS